MKTPAIIGVLLLAAGSALAQSPPVVATNIVRLTPQTTLRWNPNPATENIAGYWAEMSQGTNSWRRFVATNEIPILTLNSNAASGLYTFRAWAVNAFGLEGSAGQLTTNLATLPTVTVNLRLEVSLSP